MLWDYEGLERGLVAVSVLIRELVDRDTLELMVWQFLFVIILLLGLWPIVS